MRPSRWPWNDRSRHAVEAPEAARRGLDVAALERPADRGRRNDPACVAGAVLDLGDNLDREAVARARFGEKGRRARPAFAEMKVPSDHDRADAEPRDKDSATNSSARQRGERGVEGQHDDAGKPEALAERSP